MNEKTTTVKRAASNSGFAKKRVQWLIKHTTSHQHLWFVDSFVLPNPPLRKDNAEKKWFVENPWISAVNALKDKYGYPELHFVEIANDIRDIKNHIINIFLKKYKPIG